MKKSKKKLIYLSLSFVVLGIVIFIFINSISGNLFEFVRINFSPDQTIDGGVASFKTNIYFLIISLFGIAAFLYLLTLPLIRKLLDDFFLDEKVIDYFFEDEYTSRSFLKFTVITTTLVNLLIVLLFKLNKIPQFSFLFGEDNFFEWLTAIFFLVASIVLFIAVIGIYRDKVFQFEGKNLFLLGTLIFSIFCFWVFGEEISWGQRIFNWSTPEQFGMNFQNETTMHNFFNPIINSVYALVLLFIVAIIFIGWIRNRKKTSVSFQIFFPHSSMFPAALFLLFTSSQGEMSEIILSFFVFFYSLRVFIVSKNINTIKN